MNIQCKNCPLLFCDFISPDCRLSAREIATDRKDLVKPTRSEYLRNYDAERRRKRDLRAMQRIVINPDGVFARRRARRLLAINV